jgi:hypothetical protein
MVLPVGHPDWATVNGRLMITAVAEGAFAET